MFCNLLSLALAGTALSLLGTSEPLLVGARSAAIQIGSPKTSLPTILLRHRLLNAGDARDCIDDTDTSDESSSAKERTQEFGKVMSRSVLLLSRTRFVPGTPAPEAITLALFYVFCVLLI